MIKIAFLFLTIAGIQHESVWQHFFANHEDSYSIYVHSKEGLNHDSPFKQYEMVTTVPTTWANTMRAQIAMLKEALEDQDNAKFIFVSGDALPLQNFAFVYQRVLQHPFSIFPFWWNHHQDSESTFYYPGRVLGGVPADKQYLNSQWVILNRKHAELMVRDQTLITIVDNQLADNEHYPSTLLAMNNLLCEVVNQATTLTVWHRGYKHPYTFYNLQDRYQSETLIEAIIQGQLFARKIADEMDADAFQELIDKYGIKAD